MKDRVEFEELTYDLVSADGAALFTPESAGVRAQSFSTASWRGYVCTYVVAEGRLQLRRLLIGLDEEQLQHAALSDSAVFLDPPRQVAALAWVFDNLAEPVPFSGRLTLGGEPIASMMDHRGPVVQKYGRVVELVLEAGSVTTSVDRSVEIAAERDRG